MQGKFDPKTKKFILELDLDPKEKEIPAQEAIPASNGKPGKPAKPARKALTLAGDYNTSKYGVFIGKLKDGREMWATGQVYVKDATTPQSVNVDELLG